LLKIKLDTRAKAKFYNRFDLKKTEQAFYKPELLQP